MKKINLTNARVHAIKPQSTLARYGDEKVPYLVLRVTARGAKTFVYFRRVKGKLLTIAIGGFPAIPVDRAKQVAQQISGRIAQGLPPVEAAPEDDLTTFGQVFESYLVGYAKPHKRSWKGDEDMHRLYIREWDPRAIEDISKVDVRAIFSGLGEDHPTAANRLLALIRKVFNYAIDDLDLDIRNPARGIKKYLEEPRKRYLNESEVERLLKGLDRLQASYREEIRRGKVPANGRDWDFWRDFFQVLLFSGARKTIVQEMEWRELDLENGCWHVPAEKMKGKKSAVIVLAEEVVKILRKRPTEGRYVFPGHSKDKDKPLKEIKKAWRALCEEIGLSDVRPHDIRRTFGSWQLQAGADMVVVRDSLSQQDIRTTQASYAHLNIEAVKDSVEKTVKKLRGRQ